MRTLVGLVGRSSVAVGLAFAHLCVGCAGAEDLPSEPVRPGASDGSPAVVGVGTGGAPSAGSGGAVGANGGATNSGGTAGAANGGASSTSTGGTKSTGGSIGAAGTTGSGGTANTGGAPGTGGTISTGGASGAGGGGGQGGTIGTGGACGPGMSGALGAGGANDAGSNPDATASPDANRRDANPDANGSSSFCATGASAFCDDFEDGNACGWTPSGGAWSVTSDGSFVYTGGGGSYNSTAGKSAWTDQTVEAKVKILGFGGSGSSYRAGIVARFAGSTNFYTLAIDAAGDVRLLRGSSSPSGASGTCDAVPSGLSSLTNTWIDLKLQVSGAAGNVHILTWVNGNAVHDCTTKSSTVAAGKAGVMTYGSSTRAEFGDFRVTTP